jgi:hypothetical protein
MIGPAYREVDVAAAAEFKLIDRGFSGSEVLLHQPGKAIKTFKSYSGKQVVPAVEVTVGSIVGDAGTARDLAQSESAGADLADKGYGGFEKRVAQIGMMVGSSGHRLFLPEHVDKSNIES